MTKLIIPSGGTEIELQEFADGKPSGRWYPLRLYNAEKGSIAAGEILLVMQVLPKGTCFCINNKVLLTLPKL